jgi:hypothetical protein
MKHGKHSNAFPALPTDVRKAFGFPGSHVFFPRLRLGTVEA